MRNVPRENKYIFGSDSVLDVLLTELHSDL